MRVRLRALLLTILIATMTPVTATAFTAPALADCPAGTNWDGTTCR